MQNYSPLFHTLYDEQKPVGCLGRGTHYSVFGAVQWVDKRKKPLTVPCIQKFAIVWDEDHDERVIEVVERAYMSGIFAPVLYVGERKGQLTVLVDKEFHEIIQGDWVSYNLAWRDICSRVAEDVWAFEEIKVWDGACSGIIMAEEDKVKTYLKNINNLWSLGLTPFSHPRTTAPPPGVQQGQPF